MRTVTTRTISGRVNGDGTVSMAGDFTVRRTALGNYTLTFPAGFRFTGISIVTTGGGTGVAATGGMTDRSINVSLFASTTGANGDAAWTFVAVGAG